MQSIVTDPSKDYIYGDNFLNLAAHLDYLVHRACRTIRTTTKRPTTTPLSSTTTSTVKRSTKSTVKTTTKRHPTLPWTSTITPRTKRSTRRALTGTRKTPNTTSLPSSTVPLPSSTVSLPYCDSGTTQVTPPPEGNARNWFGGLMAKTSDLRSKGCG